MLHARRVADELHGQDGLPDQRQQEGVAHGAVAAGGGGVGQGHQEAVQYPAENGTQAGSSLCFGLALLLPGFVPVIVDVLFLKPDLPQLPV